MSLKITSTKKLNEDYNLRLCQLCRKPESGSRSWELVDGVQNENHTCHIASVARVVVDMIRKVDQNMEPRGEGLLGQLEYLSRQPTDMITRARSRYITKLFIEIMGAKDDECR